MTKIKYLTMLTLLTLMCDLSFGQKVEWITLNSTPEILSGPDNFSFKNIDWNTLSLTPEYKAAQAELDKFSINWQKEIDAEYSEIDAMKKAYATNAISMTNGTKRKRENEIINKEEYVKKLQRKRFGLGGDLYKKRQELIKQLLG